MAGTGSVGFEGRQPVVTQVERILLSQIPEAEREAIMRSTVKREHTRSGEAVFNKRDYEAWKAQR